MIYLARMRKGKGERRKGIVESLPSTLLMVTIRVFFTIFFREYVILILLLGLEVRYPYSAHPSPTWGRLASGGRPGGGQPLRKKWGQCWVGHCSHLTAYMYNI